MLTFSSAIALWLCFTCGICFSLLPYSERSTVDAVTCNWIVTSLIFFNNLNIFIAFCEICLGFHIKFIQNDYQKLLTKYKGKEWDGILALFLKPLTVADLFNGKTWALMWSNYALFDPSYQNQESYGFFIDVGNGWSTIPPCILLNVAILFPDLVSPLLVGCITIASYWQILYGTLIYFLSFLFNKRYEGHNIVSLGLFVAFTNGIWILFPSLAIYAAVIILRDGNFDIFSIQ